MFAIGGAAQRQHVWAESWPILASTNISMKDVQHTWPMGMWDIWFGHWWTPLKQLNNFWEMLDIQEEWHVGVVNARGWRTKRTSVSVDWEHSMDHMVSIQEMRSKQDPESISADLHNLGSEKIYKFMYPNITTQIFKNLQQFTIQNLQHIYKSKFTSHLQNYLSSM